MTKQKAHYWKTCITHAVELDDHLGQGSAVATGNMIDNTIVRALDTIAGRVGAVIKLVSVSCSPIKFSNSTFFAVTVVGEIAENDQVREDVSRYYNLVQARAREERSKE